MRKSFALRVLVLCFLVLALPLLIDTFIFFKHSNSSAIKEVKGDLKELGMVRGYSLEEELLIDSYLVDGLTYILEKESKQKNFSTQKLNEILTKLQESTPQYHYLIIARPEKGGATEKIIAASDAALGETFTTSSCLEILLQGGRVNVLRRLYIGKEKIEKPFILAGKSIQFPTLPEKDFIFIIYTDISEYLKKILQPTVDGNNYFAIVQQEGFVTAASDPNLVGHVFPILAENREGWKEEVANQRLGDIIPKKPLKISQEENPPFFEFFFNGEIQLAYYRTVPICSTYFIVYTEKNTFFAEGIKNFLFIYCLYGLILIFGGGCTFWFTLYLSRPLQQLAIVMNKVADNNLQVRFQKLPFGYEINFLGEVFNNTLDSLLDNMKALENVKVEKEAIRREIFIGKEVQNRLIPYPTFITEEVEIEGRYKSIMNVGGDFLDYSIRHEKDEDRISLVVADSAGKGISSCLYALSLRSLLRSNLTLSSNISEILQATNNSFLDLAGDTGMFVTLLMGMYHSKSKVLHYYSCGSLPGIILRGQEVIELEHRGLAMGLIELTDIEVDLIQMQKGDYLIFFTDGVIAAMNQRGMIFSRKRLIEKLKSQEWHSAKELVNEVLLTIDIYREGVAFINELTILVMKIK